MIESLNLPARAKINLILNILRKREDGYHEISTLFQSVALADYMTFEKIKKNTVVLTCDSRHLPINNNNLVYKAADFIFSRYKIYGGIRINLKKNIPLAAGLGGGSSDAALTLKAINRLYLLDLPDDELEKIAVQLGSDVPFFIKEGLAQGEGKGEILTSLSPMPSVYVVLAKPPFKVSTARVYQQFDSSKITSIPSLDKALFAIAKGSWEELAREMTNMLEGVTITQFPLIQTLKDKMMEAGALVSLMSGSGGTVFGIALSEETAWKMISSVITVPKVQVYLTKTQN